MKKLLLLLSILLTTGIPLWRTFQERRRRRNRLQSVAAATRDRAAGLGESAWDTLAALLDPARAMQPRDLDARQRAAGLAGRAGAAVATIPRLVEQFQAGAGIPRGRNEDWREYGNVFR